MNYTVTKYPQGTFSWADFYSTDMEATKNFFKKVLGWEAEDSTEVPYTMFKIPEGYVAGGSNMAPEGFPPSWSCYVSVDDIDEITTKATELGGKVIVAPMEVLESGKMAGVQDPTGAVVMFWEPKDHIGAGVVNKVGAMVWNELYTNDVEAAKTFYGNLLGWEFDTESSNGYTMIKNNGRANGGIMKISAEMGDMPPHWIPYFTVEKLDSTLTIVEEANGTVVMGPVDLPGIGRMAVIAEPSGAACIAAEFSVAPEEWVE